MKNKSGITLIALIVSIIVLVILAGVTINALLGSKSIVNNAEKAVKLTDENTIKEEMNLILSSYYMENLSSGVGFEVYVENKEGVESVTELEGKYVVNYKGYEFIINTTKFKIESINSLTGISLNKKDLKAIKGQKVTLEATLNRVSGTINWNSSDESVATVDNTGEVDVVGDSGTAIITAKVGSGIDEYTATCTVKIVSKLTSLTISDNNFNLNLAENRNLTIPIVTEPSNNIEDLIYESSDESVATIDESGKVTGIKRGTTTINVKGAISTDITASCTLKVIDESVTRWLACIGNNNSQGYTLNNIDELLEEDELITELINSSTANDYLFECEGIILPAVLNDQSAFTKICNNQYAINKVCDSVTAKTTIYNNSSVTESIIANSSTAISAITQHSELVSVYGTAGSNYAKRTMYNGKAYVLSFSCSSGYTTGKTGHGSYINGSSFIESDPGSCKGSNGTSLAVKKFASIVQGYRTDRSAWDDFNYYAVILKIEE